MLDTYDFLGRIKFYASASQAAYCEARAGCRLFQDGLAQNANEYFGVGFAVAGWQVEAFFGQTERYDTEGYIMHHHDLESVLVAFRGSDVTLGGGLIRDWVGTSFDIRTSEMSGERISGRVHNGFLSAFAEAWRGNRTDTIHAIIEKHQLGKKTFHLTGHSLGGALSQIAAATLINHDYNVGSVTTFASPKVGKQDFANSYDEVLFDVTETVVCRDDPVPRLPSHSNDPYFLLGRILHMQGSTMREGTVVQSGNDIPFAKMPNPFHHRLEMDYFTTIASYDWSQVAT
ncbi:MAG: lipase family protein [Pseudobacteriovorax sp.]|nr:lipase family protein [Pseudobacteriovorax sp.]